VKYRRITKKYIYLEVIDLEKSRLREFVTFVRGINTTRAEIEAEAMTYYDHASFQADYKYEDVVSEDEAKSSFQNNPFLNEGDVVINNSLNLAAMVGKNNVGKVLSLNFTKIEFDDSEHLDKQYFLYLFNVYKEVKRQKERELQGNAMLRIPLHALGDMSVPVVPLEEQKKIGTIYIETLKIQDKLKQSADLIGRFTSSIIEETLKGK